MSNCITQPQMDAGYAYTLQILALVWQRKTNMPYSGETEDEYAIRIDRECNKALAQLTEQEVDDLGRVARALVGTILCLGEAT